jgi:predicted ArsR family transcriptional regulator
MGPDRGRQQQMAAIGLLADELRQRLYRFVAARPMPVTRDQAAAAAGIPRKLAAFHLDKLVARLLAGAGRAVGPRRWAVVRGRAAGLCGRLLQPALTGQQSDVW